MRSKGQVGLEDEERVSREWRDLAWNVAAKRELEAGLISFTSA